MIVVSLSIRRYKGQIIPEQNSIDQQTDIFLVDDSGARETSFVDSSGFGTGSDFGLPSIPFLPIALLMIPMVMMTMMTMMSTVTSETSVAPIPVVPRTGLATVPTTQADVQTTPCVPTTCPTSYRLLADQTISPNCYSYDEDTERNWGDALESCTLIPGSYLWRPNTQDEANAVFNLFNIDTSDEIWTGANSPTHNENFVVAGDTAAFSLTNLPFGEWDEGDFGEDCVEIEVNTLGVWLWENEDCRDEIPFICELPRVSTSF
ncbi:unnamed protein product [Mytilus edulis]|uniref:C-type lectin domain-containing protein n=1 Tax=Mytilus edulis TaxID=6550 RepID=A0A8S3R6G2_MYTED|nr:unnamed protein product [Mytilus edulis]